MWMSVNTLSGILCGRIFERRHWHDRDTLVGTMVVSSWDHGGNPRFILSDSCNLPINLNLKLGHPYRYRHLLSSTAASLATQEPATVFPAGSSHSMHNAQMSPVLVLWCPGQRGLRQGTLRIMPQMVHFWGTTLLGGLCTMETLLLSRIIFVFPPRPYWR